MPVSESRCLGLPQEACFYICAGRSSVEYLVCVLVQPVGYFRRAKPQRTWLGL